MYISAIQFAICRTKLKIKKSTRSSDFPYSNFAKMLKTAVVCSHPFASSVDNMKKRFRFSVCSNELKKRPRFSICSNKMKNASFFNL